MDDFAAQIRDIEQEIAGSNEQQSASGTAPQSRFFDNPERPIVGTSHLNAPLTGMNPSASPFTTSNTTVWMNPGVMNSPMANSTPMTMNPSTGAGILSGAPNPAHSSVSPQHTFSKDSDERSIFVGNLPKHVPVTAEELVQFFSDCGTILNCTLLKDRATNEPKGTAYIEFSSYAAMGMAIDGKNNAVFKGNALIVTKKRSNFRPDRARGRGGARGAGPGVPSADPYQAIAALMSMVSNSMPTAPSPYRGRGRGRGAPHP